MSEMTILMTCEAFGVVSYVVGLGGGTVDCTMLQFSKSLSVKSSLHLSYSTGSTGVSGSSSGDCWLVGVCWLSVGSGSMEGPTCSPSVGRSSTN